MTDPQPSYSIVIPSIGRPSLDRLLAALARCPDLAPEVVVIADDRRFDGDGGPSALDVGPLPWPVRVVRTGGRGPAAARNAGWRSTTSDWVVFLDDDVEVSPDWGRQLGADIAAAATDVGGIQAGLVVPLPSWRRPTDWERNTAGLESASWITADMAYRRAALRAVHGFDERFPRAYREDSDLALRVQRAGWRLTRGGRTVMHPVRPADDWVSVRVQAGGRDDALMRALHGPGWREATDAGRGRFRRHLATVALAVAAAGLTVTRRWTAATALSIGWLALTAEFLYRRLSPGPRPRDQVWPAEARRMAVTSVLIPFAATRHRTAGLLEHGLAEQQWPLSIRAVLFDRDGTLVHDEPYNGDPAKVRVVPGARAVLDQLRDAGIAVGVISNQSGIGRGMLTTDQVIAVNERIERELGPFDVWQFCPHLPGDRCICRKPLPGMVLAAAAALRLPPYRCAVIGDIGADIEAATAAGAVGVLVPTPVTLSAEVDRTEIVASDLAGAVTAALRSRGQAAGTVATAPVTSEANGVAA